MIEAETNDDEKNNKAIALLFQSIPETLILQVGELDTAKKVWDAIKSRHMGADRVREAWLQTIMSEFDRLKMKDSDKIDDFVGKLSEISSKSTALGETIDETKLVKKFLSSLPRKKYIHIVASLKQVLDLKTTSFEDIIGRLKTYEERVAEEEEDAQDTQKLMYATRSLTPPTQTARTMDTIEVEGVEEDIIIEAEGEAATMIVTMATSIYQRLHVIAVIRTDITQPRVPIAY